MNQQLLIQSGCQQWIRQPAAIGPSQFAVSSSLAIYVHGSEDYRLIRILAQHNQHLNAVCWSPVDTKLLACATSEQVGSWRMIPNRQGFRCWYQILAKQHTGNQPNSTVLHQWCRRGRCLGCCVCALLCMQVVKVYNVESEGVVYSAQLPVSHAIKKLCW